MRSLLTRRPVFILLAALAILALAVLASGLNEVDFAEGRPFRQAESGDISFSVEELMHDLASVSLRDQVLLWVGVGVLVLIVSSLLSPDLRKKLLRLIAQFAVLLIAIQYLAQNNDRFGAVELELTDTAPEQESVPGLDLEPPVFSAPEISPAVTYLISVLLVLVVIAVAWSIGRGIHLRQRVPIPDLPLEAIAAAARSTLRDLSAGGNWEDSILRCYERMIEVVARTRSFEREVHITPSEFASRLEEAGLPSLAVRRLTNLFESVRYGARQSDTREVNEAVQCLREVLHYCGQASA